jgi:LacI family transcriptional regulator
MSVRQIAIRLGLSAAAVSMALNNHPKIPEKTRRRVRGLARRLGYKSNAKVVELMKHLRSARQPKIEACLGVISFYETRRPWEQSQHLSRMYEGMKHRADALGYRLEPFWLRAPDVTARRLRSVLDARGIEGLLCFGSPRVDEEFPRELNHYAIVTQGWSIRAPLHRVVNHGFNNTWRALEKLHDLGYRRPGIVVGRNLDVRASHANISAYYGWCDHMFGLPALMPPLRVVGVEEKPVLDWLALHRPDVLLFNHDYEVLPELSQLLLRHGIRMPDDMGVAAISQLLGGTPFAGFEENQTLMGEAAVEMLIGRLTHRDVGIARHPRVEMVESVWVEGRSLRSSA